MFINFSARSTLFREQDAFGIELNIMGFKVLLMFKVRQGKKSHNELMGGYLCF